FCIINQCMVFESKSSSEEQISPSGGDTIQ
ncbi:unnamed protein product, partial [Rotaria magnacalcarata]